MAFQCKEPDCGFQGSSKHNLSCHSAVQHLLRKTFGCARCSGAAFSSESSALEHIFQEHFKNQNDKKQKTCPFSQKQPEHAEKKPKPNTVTVLKESFVQVDRDFLPLPPESAIPQSVKLFSSAAPKDQVTTFSRGKAAGTFECNLCHLVLGPDKKRLKKHAKVAHLPKRFHCPVCGQGFTLWTDMIAHGKIHDLLTQPRPSVKKKWTCKICGQGFSKKTRLELHYDGIHHQVRTFACSSCGFTGRTRLQLLRHHRTEHAHPKRT